MLVIRTKSQYQYLYIQEITHVFSNIHKNKHFRVSNTHINKKQYTHQTRTENHQNQERALASHLPSSSKPNTETSIYRKLTFHEWVRAREWLWERECECENEMIARERPVWLHCHKECVRVRVRKKAQEMSEQVRMRAREINDNENESER